MDRRRGGASAAAFRDPRRVATELCLAILRPVWILLIVDAGLLAIAWRGGPRWLHAAGGVATLITFLIWLRASYTHRSWPWLLLWLALFIALYLVRATPFGGLLFGVFIGIAIREPQQWAMISR